MHTNVYGSIIYKSLKKKRASERDQWVKLLAIKAKDLCWIPGTQMVEAEKWLPLSSDFHALRVACANPLSVCLPFSLPSSLPSLPPLL